jgi:hypothetical protein
MAVAICFLAAQWEIGRSAQQIRGPVHRPSVFFRLRSMEFKIF